MLDSLPNGDTISRHGLWINANYIAGMVEDIYRREFPVHVRQISKAPAIDEKQTIRLRRTLTGEGYILPSFAWEGEDTKTFPYTIRQERSILFEQSELLDGTDYVPVEDSSPRVRSRNSRNDIEEKSTSMNPRLSSSDSTEAYGTGGSRDIVR